VHLHSPKVARRFFFFSLPPRTEWHFVNQLKPISPPRFLFPPQASVVESPCPLLYVIEARRVVRATLIPVLKSLWHFRRRSFAFPFPYHLHFHIYPLKFFFFFFFFFDSTFLSTSQYLASITPTHFKQRIYLTAQVPTHVPSGVIVPRTVHTLLRCGLVRSIFCFKAYSCGKSFSDCIMSGLGGRFKFPLTWLPLWSFYLSHYSERFIQKTAPLI